MKGGYEIVTLGSEQEYAFGQSAQMVNIDEVRAIERAINSGKPVLLYPNFRAGGFVYTSPFFAICTKGGGTRIGEIHIGRGSVLIIYNDYRISYSGMDNPVTADENLEDPYAMSAMEV